MKVKISSDYKKILFQVSIEILAFPLIEKIPDRQKSTEVFK